MYSEQPDLHSKSILMDEADSFGRSKQAEFLTKKPIGEGTFGKVEKCIRKSDDKLVAVKIIDTIIEVQLIREEAQLMMKIRSDYTLELLDHFHDEKLAAYILVLPFYRKGSLSTIMHRIWDSKDIVLFLYQIQKAFLEIYKSKVWHLDLKPDNILIKSEGEYLVCDFGCAKLVDNPKVSQMIRMSMTKGAGSTNYASPELILNLAASKYSDMWSLGVILYEILYKSHPLKQESTAYTTVLEDFLHGKVRIQYPQIFGYEKIIELCKKMLTGSYQKTKRITWEELGDQIFSILKLTKMQNRVTLITDINELISYGTNVNTVLSGLIYYLEINKGFLVSEHANPTQLIHAIKLYMNCHLETIDKALTQGNQTEHYFIFPTTLRGFTQAKSVKMSHLLKRTQSFLKDIDKSEKNVKFVEIRLGFKSECQAFQSKIKNLENTKPQTEWYKIDSTLKGILKGIGYENKEAVKQMALKLVYN